MRPFDFIILLSIFFGGIVFVYFLFKKELSKLKNKEDVNLVQLIQDNLDRINQTLFQFTERFHRNLQELTEKSAKTDENVKNLLSVTEEIKTLKDILKGPQERGYFGEVLLEEILNQLPSKMILKQHTISGFQRVDYAIKVNDNIIPIDSKFPLNNYLQLKEDVSAKKDLIKNLKEKIKSIHQKYIQPSQGSVEFAILYLPNEGLYYELFQDKIYQEVWDFARENSVVIVSPKIFEYVISILILAQKRTLLKDQLDSVLQELAQLEKDGKELTEQFLKAHRQIDQGLKNLKEFQRILNRFLHTFFSVLRDKNN